MKKGDALKKLDRMLSQKGEWIQGVGAEVQE